MKIIDERMLDRFRRATRCECCGQSIPYGAEPHHLFAKGMGGGGRLDVALNLMSLCSLCHRRFHDGTLCDYDPRDKGKKPREKLIEIVATREGTQPWQLEHRIHELRRMRK